MDNEFFSSSKNVFVNNTFGRNRALAKTQPPPSVDGVRIPLLTWSLMAEQMSDCHFRFLGGCANRQYNNVLQMKLGSVQYSFINFELIKVTFHHLE